MKKITVQKFGGSSLQNEAARLLAVSKVKIALSNGLLPVVVVSALGRKGDPYSTDTLLEQAQKVHIKINPRESDLLLSCGEIISAVIMAQMLVAEGLEAVALTGFQAGLLTDEKFGAARIESIDSRKIEDYLEQGKIPVIAGYQGISAGNEITTLGRGGSDTTAAIIASALQADSLEIYSDVDGLLTADPRIVQQAKFIREASYEEVVELAHKGAKIIHPAAVEIAQQADIPIYLKPTFSDAAGSKISKIRSMKPVTGVTSNSQIVFFQLEELTHSAQLLTDIADEAISLDMIDISPQKLSFLVSQVYKTVIDEYLLRKGIKFVIREDLCKISVVGTGMSGVPGVIARISAALHDSEIEIYKSMDSHTAISCLIKKTEEALAVNLLHQEFRLE